MEQAVDAAIITHGPIDNGVDVKWSTGDIFTKYMKPELIYSGECGAGKTSCYGGAGPSSSVILLDGIGIGASGTTLYVDVNNGNLPNVDGVDLFTFQFQEIGADATAGTRGDWKIVPQGNAKKVADDGWKIKYW